MLAVDISNHNAFTPASAQQLKAAGVEHVIIRGGLSIERAGLVETSHRQLAICRDASLGVSLYGWAYFNAASPVATAEELVAEYNQYDPASYWIDCEDEDGYAYNDWRLNRDWLQSCLGAFDPRLKVGIYTGRWWWTKPNRMNDTAAFRDYPLWVATDDQTPDLRFVPFGGWTEAAIEQYDLHGLDRDVVADDLFNGRTGVVEPTVDEQLSYLGGLTHDVLPAVLAEAEEALTVRAASAKDEHLRRIIAALRENVA